ncbi:unnamed protein product [Rotaria magnacalcarata]|uniref:Helicase ATP-binding domain-containing protein n=1 Tax=Rotaria magnacalcarata TaxID=392030 RepID=A0A816FK73_9BILA|nr:unnamed protein product [Rotaria magnacalcarata]
MKRTHEDNLASPSVIAKQFTYEITTTDLSSPIEEIQDYASLDLEPFEKSPIWSNNYLSQLNIQRRPFAFQIELVQSVINSGNSLVSLRTGAGKTYIAALLIKYYYMKKQKEENKQFLTFFFIPNRSIRDQQVTAIRDVGDLRVMPCDDDSSVHEFVQYSHVIVCTPQKFLNCLIDKTIFFNQVDLLIFDECHHCIGNHPYSKIMEQYLVYHPLEHQPKIIGLTASCGTKLTRSELVLKELLNSQERQHNALNKLYELCATLNCNDVSRIIDQWRAEADWKKIVQSKLQDSEGIDGKVSCRTCDYYLGEISWIRKRNSNYFVRQQQLAEHVEIELYSSAQMYKEIQVNGKVRCGNRKCREDIGGVQQYTDRPDIKEICALACKKLKFTLKDQHGDYQVSTVKKWTEVTFKIPELEPLMSTNAAPDQP